MPTGSHSKQLRKDLVAAGYGQPGSGWQAAHIVPTNNFSNRSQQVQGAIEIAQNKFNTYLGADLRDTSINGFWALAGHAGTHTDAFFIDLGKSFSKVTSKQQAEKTLSKVWSNIEAGKYAK